MRSPTEDHIFVWHRRMRGSGHQGYEQTYNDALDFGVDAHFALFRRVCRGRQRRGHIAFGEHDGLIVVVFLVSVDAFLVFLVGLLDTFLPAFFHVVLGVGRQTWALLHARRRDRRGDRDVSEVDVLVHEVFREAEGAGGRCGSVERLVELGRRLDGGGRRLWGGWLGAQSALVGLWRGLFLRTRVSKFGAINTRGSLRAA